jgi:hypothetical protein
VGYDGSWRETILVLLEASTLNRMPELFVVVIVEVPEGMSPQ